MMNVKSINGKHSKAGWGCVGFRYAQPADVDAIGIGVV
jgi:hypothetical protein